ncbi:hypothetical protein O1L60_45550 [Streptomyces diastatochromogenes]|nr:hypothetical protein [Streptomyces diastatochromogenes]
MSAAKRFDPEMNGGLQLGFDLFEEEHQEQAATGPATVVCPEDESCNGRVLAEPADAAEAYEPGGVPR